MMSNLRPFSMILASLALTAAGIATGASPAAAVPPPNDDIGSATAVSSLTFTDSVDTTEATYAATDSTCGVATVWYRFTAPVDGWVEFNTAGSDYDTTLALLTGDPPDLTLQQCNDDSDFGLQSQLFAQVEAGATYYIEAGTCCGSTDVGTVGPGGNLVFNVEEADPPVSEITLTIDGATVSRDGTATVRGTITCDQEARGYVYLQLRQRWARAVAAGEGYAEGSEINCETTPTSWTALIQPYTSTVFGGGRATLEVYSFVQNGSGATETSLTIPRIQLRGGRG